MQNMKTLCNITKMLSNDKPKQNAGIFDEKGRLITKKYGNSTSVLNREGPVNPVGVEETDDICEINCE